MRQSLVLVTVAALLAASFISSANGQGQDGMAKMMGAAVVKILDGCIKGDPCEIFNKKCLKFLQEKAKDAMNGKMPDIMAFMSDAKTGGCDSLMKIIMNSFMG